MKRQSKLERIKFIACEIAAHERAVSELNQRLEAMIGGETKVTVEAEPPRGVETKEGRARRYALKLVKNGDLIKRADVMERAGVSGEAAARALNNLVAARLITKKGKRAGTRYGKA